MKNQFKFYFFFVLVIPFILTACSKDEMQAEDSIKGTWDVVEIISQYGVFSTNGYNPTETVTEDGDLGSFIFGSDEVDFNFIRNDTTYSGSGSWNLSTEKVNSGFTKVTEFTLSIDDHFIFDTMFEDGTKNSEKNAKRVTFIETPTVVGFGVSIEMVLEKQ